MLNFIDRALSKADLFLYERFLGVTQFAHKKLGKDKYDMMETTQKLGGAAIVGSSFYGSIATSLSANHVLTALILPGLFFGGRIIRNAKKNSDRLREMEFEMTASGNIEAPEEDVLRPIEVLAGLGLTIMGIYGLFESYPVPGTIMRELGERGNKLFSLVSLTSGVLYKTAVANSYFRSQPPNPPEKEETFNGELVPIQSPSNRNGNEKTIESLII
jgi:hypothetical protein